MRFAAAVRAAGGAAGETLWQFALPQHLVRADSKELIRAWNPAMASITGYTAENAVGRGIDGLLEMRREQGATGADQDAEIVRRDGTKRWIRCSSNRCSTWRPRTGCGPWAMPSFSSWC